MRAAFLFMLLRRFLKLRVCLAPCPSSAFIYSVCIKRHMHALSQSGDIVNAATIPEKPLAAATIPEPALLNNARAHA